VEDELMDANAWEETARLIAAEMDAGNTLLQRPDADGPASPHAPGARRLRGEHEHPVGSLTGRPRG